MGWTRLFPFFSITTKLCLLVMLEIVFPYYYSLHSRRLRQGSRRPSRKSRTRVSFSSDTQYYLSCPYSISILYDLLEDTPTPETDREQHDGMQGTALSAGREVGPGLYEDMQCMSWNMIESVGRRPCGKDIPWWLASDWPTPITHMSSLCDLRFSLCLTASKHCG